MKRFVGAWLLLACACARPESTAQSPSSAPAASAGAVQRPPTNEGKDAGAPHAHGHDHEHSEHAHGHEHDAHVHEHGDGHGHAHGFKMDFSEVERFARHFDDPARDAWQKPDEVVKLMAIAPGLVVADIGAGTGYFLRHLSAAVGARGRVIALDVEPNMVEYMKRRAREAGWTNVEARVVPPDDPGLGPASVDRVLVVNTWHHIGGRSEYARKLGRALRPGGLVAIVDFTRESDIGPPPEHRLPAEQVIAELRAGGLEAEVVRTETLPKQYVVVGRVSN